jgi:CubicO group peptidase (beta-lactamase class C family)
MKKIMLPLLVIFSQVFVVKSYANAEDSPYHKVISKFTEHNVFSGTVLVAKDGKILFERGYGIANETWQVPNDINTKFSIASLTKSMASLLVIKLVQEGKLSLSDTVDKYLDYFPKDKASKISIKDLLGHRSGLPRQFVLPGWRDGKYDRFNNKVEYAKLIGELALIAEPGEHYQYTNLGYFLLGLIVEEATKTTYKSALNHYIFAPLKMDNTGTVAYKEIIKNHATGYQIAKDGNYQRPAFLNVEFLFWAEGNIYSTVGDILKFDQALYQNIILNDKHRDILLSKENGFSWTVKPWKIKSNTKELHSISWGGEIPGYSSFLLRLVDKKNTIIVLSNNATTEVEKRRLANELAAVLYDEETSLNKLPLSFVLTKALYDNELDKKIVEIKNHLKSYKVDESIATMGLQLMWSGDLTKAITLLAFNADILPDSPAAHNNLSKVFEENKQLKKALQSKQRALVLLPDNPYLKDEIKRLMLRINNI